MQQDPEILALQRRIESLERTLRSGVATNQTITDDVKAERVVIRLPTVRDQYGALLLPGDPYFEGGYHGIYRGIIMDNPETPDKTGEYVCTVAVEGEFDLSEFPGWDHSGFSRDTAHHVINDGYVLRGTGGSASLYVTYRTNKYSCIEYFPQVIKASHVAEVFTIYANETYPQYSERIIIRNKQVLCNRSWQVSCLKTSVFPNYSGLAINEFVFSNAGEIQRSGTYGLSSFPQFAGEVVNIVEDDDYVRVHIAEKTNVKYSIYGTLFTFDGFLLGENFPGVPVFGSSSATSSLTPVVVNPANGIDYEYYPVNKKRFNALGYSPQLAISQKLIGPNEFYFGTYVTCGYMRMLLPYVSGWFEIEGKNCVGYAPSYREAIIESDSDAKYTHISSGYGASTISAAVFTLPHSTFVNSTELAKIQISLTVLLVAGSGWNTYSASGPGLHQHGVYSGSSHSFSFTLNDLPTSEPGADNFGNFRIWVTTAGSVCTLRIKTSTLPAFYYTANIESNYPMG